MIRMIQIVNQATGKTLRKPSNTITLDVPDDFDRHSLAASLDSHSRARYQTTGGKTVNKATVPRPLSWRVHGEECLIADRAGTSATEPGDYTLARVAEL